MQEIYKFLGVSESITPRSAEKSYNSSKARYSRLYWFINRLYLFLKGSRLGNYFLQVLRKSGLRGKHIETFLSKRKISKENLLSLEGEKYLAERLNGEAEKIESLLGEKIKQWSFSR